MRVYSRNVLLLTSHVFPTQTKTRHQSHAFCQLFLCNILFFSKLFKKTSNFFLFHFVPPSTDRLVYFIDFNHDTKREIDFFIWTTMSISIFCLLFPKNKNPHPGKFEFDYKKQSSLFSRELSDCRQSPALLCGIFLGQLLENSVIIRTFWHFSGTIEVSNQGRYFYL